MKTKEFKPPTHLSAEAAYGYECGRDAVLQQLEKVKEKLKEAQAAAPTMDDLTFLPFVLDKVDEAMALCVEQTKPESDDRS